MPRQTLNSSSTHWCVKQEELLVWQQHRANLTKQIPNCSGAIIVQLQYVVTAVLLSWRRAKPRVTSLMRDQQRLVTTDVGPARTLVTWLMRDQQGLWSHDWWGTSKDSGYKTDEGPARTLVIWLMRDQQGLWSHDWWGTSKDSGHMTDEGPTRTLVTWLLKNQQELWSNDWGGPSKDSGHMTDKGHARTLIRVFAVRMIFGYPKSPRDGSDQTSWARRLIWIFVGCTCDFVGFVVPWIKSYRFSICVLKPMLFRFNVLEATLNDTLWMSLFPAETGIMTLSGVLILRQNTNMVIQQHCSPLEGDF